MCLPHPHKQETAMKRTIVTPPVLSSAALAELKQWLGITTSQDDAVLTSLLLAAVETCEAFTGIMPLQAICEEVLPLASGWQNISARPVKAITGLDAILADGSRVALSISAYSIELDADGGGRVMVTAAGDALRIAARFEAGLAADWEGLPEGLRQGMMRLAAHQHRERDASGSAPMPPAAVAALWRPWRRMRLA
jgi:uncharacterized phiE125 gp8 family phage protein